MGVFCFRCAMGVDNVAVKKSKKSKNGKKEKREKKKEKRSKGEEASKKRKREKVPATEPTAKKQKTAQTASSSAKQIVAYRKENRISVDTGDHGDDRAPVLSFDECKATFPGTTSLLNSFCKGFTKPTPIQAQCWPIALSGRDLIGIAETGSGKTLAFLLPGIVKMNAETDEKPRKRQPGILVLAPTRELAMQSDVVCNESSSETGVSSVCIAGGMDRSAQNMALKRGARVVVATPGRLISLLETNECDLSRTKYLVLDEADRMLDMGFEPDIKKIMSYLPKKRQTLMFSATWPEEIRALASQYLKNPTKVIIGSDDLSANVRVTQIVELIDPRGKDRRLEQLLTQYHKDECRILIFCLFKKEAARVERNLYQRGWNVKGIHGDMAQPQRTEAFNAFKDGSIPLLVATDVASRGLDIPNVEYVINYTFPLTIEDYIHRIGRTGRANKSGIAHTLFTVNEKGKAGDLCRILKEANQKVPAELEKFGPSFKKKKEHAMYGTHYAKSTDGDDIAQAPTRITFDSDSE